jgi:hypothetical protein
MARFITTYSIIYAFGILILYWNRTTFGSWQFCYRTLLVRHMHSSSFADFKYFSFFLLLLGIQP